MIWLLQTALAMPLQSISFEVAVDGPLAEVVVEQTFLNDSGRVMDAVYAFPLHEQAAVDAMRMEVGSIVIEGQIGEREAAEADFAAAVARGQTAAITVQQQPNLFSQRVGNIPPGEEARVKLRIIQPVPHVDGAYELVLPLVAAPRFVPQGQFNRNDPFSGAISGPQEAQVTVQIQSGLAFTRFEASHDLDVAAAGTHAWTQTASVALDRDFVMRWEVANERPQAALYVDEGHAVIALDPPEVVPRPRVVPREFIFVIDQSGSMTGEPLRLAVRAAKGILEQTDSRDSVRIVRFGAVVEGDLRARPLTAEVRAQTLAQLDGLTSSGGTYLLDGVVEALGTRDDPIRERTIVFISDGLIRDERAVLAQIADGLGKGRLFTIGVGPLPNRWLLSEMARFGGGKAAWIDPGEDPGAVVDGFVEAVEWPVLTDIQVDWGDWEVEGAWPNRLPVLFAGEPLSTGVRVLRRGVEPVYVRGWMGQGPFEAVLQPVEARSGRSVGSTWARQRIGELERDQVFGDVPELADEILTTALEYQVLSRYTAFLAIHDGKRPVEADQSKPRRRVIKTSSRGGSSRGDAIEVSASRAVIQAESTASSQVITKEVLQRIPAGRSYQSAVSMAAGTSASANLAGGGLNRNSYMLDGVNITDPVSGAFSINLASAAIESVTVTDVGTMPEIPGAAGRVTEIIAREAFNTLEAEARIGHRVRLGEPLAATHVGALVAGPVVRDKLFVVGSYDADQSAISGREFLGHRGYSRLGWQMSSKDRVTLTGALDLADGLDGEERFGQRSGLGGLRWQHFYGSDLAMDTTVSLQRQQLDDDLRDRRSLASSLRWYGARFLRAEHEIKVGLDAEQSSWRLSADRAAAWLGVPVEAQGGTTRLGLYVQDKAQLGRGLNLSGGARADLTLGRVHFAPRLYAVWDPSGRQRTRVVAGGARRYGHLGLVTAVLDADRGLSAVDEASVRVEHEVIRGVALSAGGTYRSHRDLPVFGGGRTSLRSASLVAGARKLFNRRWMFEADYQLVERLDDLEQTVLDDNSLLGHRHRLTGQLLYDLPTDPSTTRLFLSGSLLSGPLGTLVPDPVTGGLPNSARWSAAARLSQRVGIRRRALWLDLEVEHFSLLDEPPVNRWVTSQQSLPYVQGYEGTRLMGAIRFEL